MMSYKHFTPENRNELSILLRAGLKQKEIAKLLNKTPSAICQDLKRNPTNNKTGYDARIAKGRVERLFKTLQDRLIKELRLKNISDPQKANEFLEKEFLPAFNAKFMVKPRSKSNLHKKLTKQELNKLDSIFSRQYTRTVRNDFTIQHNKKYYQLLNKQAVTICKHDTVTVEERLDDTIQFRLRGKYLNYSILPEKPKKVNNTKSWVLPKSTVHTPSADHPWKQDAKLEYLKKITKMSK